MKLPDIRNTLLLYNSSNELKQQTDLKKCGKKTPLENKLYPTESDMAENSIKLLVLYD